MISNELLAMLRCPETGQVLVPASVKIIARLQTEFQAGQLCNRAGKPLPEPLHEGLVRQDGALLFPICDGIPLLILEEGIAL